MRLKLVAALAAVGVLAGPAAAATPAQQIAKQLEGTLQSAYGKNNPTFRITAVTCTVAADRTAARCLGHFAVPAKRAVGVLTVKVTSTSWTTLARSCKDSKTGVKLPNC